MKSYWKRYLPTYPFWYHFAKRYWRFWIKKMGDFFMLENRNSQQSCKVYLTKATSYFIRFMYVPVLGKTSSFLVFIFFETPRKTFFRSISIKELRNIYKNDKFFDPFSRMYLIKLVICVRSLWRWYDIVIESKNYSLNNKNDLMIQNFIMLNKTSLETLMAWRQN